MDQSNEIELPELLDDVIDTPTLQQLFVDIEQCTQLIHVNVKVNASEMVPTNKEWTLADAQALLSRDQVSGIQIRYRYQEAEWWDTVMPTPAGWRVVRIRHEFS